MKIDYANPAACKGCTLCSRCMKTYRHVSRLENEAVLDRMAARLAARPGILDRRRETVEHPFGTIKQWMGQGAFLMRRLENVRGEFSLTALAYNPKSHHTGRGAGPDCSSEGINRPSPASTSRSGTANRLPAA